MKRIFPSLLTVLLIIALPLPSLADVWQDPETKVYYEYTAGESEASVKAGSQGAEGTAQAGSPDVTGHVAIREKFTVDGNEYTVTSIGDRAFHGCTALTNVTIPGSVTLIDDSAFYGCTGLTSVILNEGLKSIGFCAFEYCSNLTAIDIPSSVTKIEYYAFARCSGLTSVILNGGLKSIGFCAFEYCSNLTAIDIPSSVTTIYGHAFHFCYNLGSVTLSEGLERINLSAFARTNITAITIPSTVTSIGNSVFAGCANLTDINILSRNASFGEYVFKDTGWYNNQPDGLLYLSHYLVGYKGSKPTGNIVVEEGTWGIADAAFYGCTELTSVTIPESVNIIGSQAFYNCPNLKSVNIPKGVTKIYSKTFWYCTGLTSITLPESVTFIGEMAFWGCVGMTSVKMYAQTPPTGGPFFSNITYSNATLYVPAGTKEAYAAATCWKNFTSVLQIGDANIDDKVDIGDVTAIINSINHEESSTFDADAADVNNDSTIDIGDVTGVINIINQ